MSLSMVTKSSSQEIAVIRTTERNIKGVKNLYVLFIIYNLRYSKTLVL